MSSKRNVKPPVCKLSADEHFISKATEGIQAREQNVQQKAESGLAKSPYRAAERIHSIYSALAAVR